MQKKTNNCETSSHYDDNKILAKSLNDQINFLKSEIKSKNAIIIMILNDKKNEVGQPKPFPIEEKTTLVTLMATTNTSFRLLNNRQTWKKQTLIKTSPSRFTIFQDYIKEHDHDLSENDPVDSNYDSNKDKKSNVEQKQQIEISYNIYFRRFNTKKCIWKYHLKGYKI